MVIPEQDLVRRSTVRTLALMACAALLAATETRSRADAADLLLAESEAKAAMLLNVVKFTEWPAQIWKDLGAPLIICVVGNNPLEKRLEKIAETQSYAGRPVRVAPFLLPGAVDTCHVLYIGRSESRRLAAVLHTVESKPVLTISDVDRFARRGGMVGFAMVENRGRFSVNPEAASKAGIVISSKLLQVAKTIETRSEAGGDTEK